MRQIRRVANGKFYRAQLNYILISAVERSTDNHVSA